MNIRCAEFQQSPPRHVAMKLYLRAEVNPYHRLYAAGGRLLLMLILGVALRFVQESRADAAAAKLKAMITVTAAVVRDGQEEEIPLKQLVPGDVINLCAGDMVPADVRLVASRDLFVAQAALTGESLPTEKSDARELREGVSPLELAHWPGLLLVSGLCFAHLIAASAQNRAA